MVNGTLCALQMKERTDILTVGNKHDSHLLIVMCIS